MINYNANKEIYEAMSIDDLHKELSKADLATEDKSLILHTIAGRRINNVTSAPLAPSAVNDTNKTTGGKK